MHLHLFPQGGLVRSIAQSLKQQSALLQRGGHLDTGRILGAFSWWLEALDEARGAVGGGNCMVELLDYRMGWYGNCMEDYGMGW